MQLNQNQRIMYLFTQPQSIVVKFTKSCFKILHIVICVNYYIVPQNHYTINIIQNNISLGFNACTENYLLFLLPAVSPPIFSNCHCTEEISK